MLTYEEALAAEAELPPGSYKVEADFGRALSGAEIAQIQDNLVTAGVQFTEISQSGGVLSITAVKQAPMEGIGFLPILIVGALGIVALGYGIFKLPSIIDSITKLVVPLGLLLLGGLVIHYAAQQKRAVR